MTTHSPESDLMFAAISGFLSDCRLTAEMETRHDFWQGRPRITTCEMDVLMALCRETLCLDAIAGMLNRDCDSARHFVEALVGVGLLEVCSGRYAATAATALYCHALRERNLPPCE